MRLLRYSESDQLSIHSFDDSAIPPYAILSHTWGEDGDEVTFADLRTGDSIAKRGYEKIRFCGQQARQDGLQYFWVDTCYIDKTNKAELSYAIRSMFRWYQNATRCYVYLSDEPTFRTSQWFTRGWTLQELLAPKTVEFFSWEWERLGDKISLKSLIHKITGRITKHKEDRAYSLLGIFDVELAPVYSEGAAGAFRRLMNEINKLERCIQDIRSTDPRDNKKRIKETKGGLLADSYCWVTDNATFQQWQGDPHSRLLWIKGDPGKGKTMLLCGIIDELKKSTNNLLSFFFCQGTDSRINSATAVLRGLIFLFVKQQPRLASHLRKRYNQAGGSLFQDANAWVALSKIFTSMMQDKGLKLSYLVIDALDKCAVDLPKLLNLIVRTTASSTHVKWLVSSRNETHIEQKLKSVGGEAKLSLELKQNAEQVARAVDVYIDHKLSCLESLGEDDLREQVRNELRRKANGTFLWVALIMQELEKPESWDPLAVVEEAPAAIGSLRKLAGRATVLAETVRKVVGMCGSFLTIRDEQVYLVHQSVKDYLSEKMRAATLPSHTEIHYDLFAQSLELMSNTLKRDIYNLGDPGFSTNKVRTPDPDPLATAHYSYQDELTQLVHDARRFIMYHKGAIESFPLQTYASALLFSPTASLIRRLFHHEEPEGITIKPEMSNGWSACLQTLEGHSDSVTSVAFSHGSARLASALHDGTVKIWDASSGACLQTLEGYSSIVQYSGLVSILASLHSETVTKKPQQAVRQGTALSLDSTWISNNSQNLVWLPTEYRPSCSTISELHTIVIITRFSGRVIYRPMRQNLLLKFT
ncbi:HET-domain-containing protein [Bimuria novae-zelandiae CBS 107.79]|uniref:HET-domain-containing protein n=1 Tax=Bimuria novae-zelandiae CBS 107.79 TaxID=1447943 RepID=A0A6A5V2R2_9PLEO|nr:HET-domain-containing protein [Bimuria novae-zelandiae CBS 107.79]